jgi:flavin-dependent dehydrogenase
VDRLKYDAYLLEKAKSVGADVLEGERVEVADPSEVMIRTREARQVKAKLLVGADGVNSTVRMSFPGERFDRPKWQRNLATAFETFIPRSEVVAPPEHPIVVLGFLSWGYSWIFPNRDRLAVGLGGLNRENPNRFLQSFDDFLAARDLGGRPKHRLAASLVPYGNYLRNPAFMRTVLVGDAAGFVDPILGEGIYYAHRSAELAASAAREYLLHGKELGACYLRLLRKHIYPDLDRAKRIRWLVFSSLDMFHRHALRPLSNRSVRKRLIRLVHGTEAQLSDATEATDSERI